MIHASKPGEVICRNTRGGRQLRCLQDGLETRTEKVRLLRHYDHIARSQFRALHSAAEQTSCSANHRSVSTHYKRGFLVCQIGGATRLPQIPTHISAGFESDGCLVVNSAIDKYNAWLFGNINHISGADLNIIISVRPPFDVR